MCTMLAAAVGAAGTIMQGVAANRAAKAQAAAAEQNAAIAEAQGHDAIERGGTEELRLRRQLAQQRGNARAQAAASGIDADSGSLLDVRNASISEGERDAAAIRYNAARERWGYQVQAQNYRNKALQARAAGRNALFGSLIGAGTQLGTAAWDQWGGTSPLVKKKQKQKQKTVGGSDRFSDRYQFANGAGAF
ncbi:MAG: hypothetical protein IJR68_03845 [Fretibacterium sp.]|nr:hypothetical protein [Fretibacterium sp.]